MREMMGRLETTEQRQNTIVGFLARLAQNPTVLQQMVSVAQTVGLQRSLNDGRNGGERGWWPGCHDCWAYLSVCCGTCKACKAISCGTERHA